MSEPEDGVRIRRAQLADRDDIINFDAAIFDGLDYLPTLYNSLLQDTNFHGYVATVNGKVVSFYGLYMSHEDKVVARVSRRTRAEFQGLNLTQRIGDMAHRDLGQILHGGYTTYWVATDKPHIFTQKYFSRPNYRLVRRGAFLKYIVPSNMVRRAADRGLTDPCVTAIEVHPLNNDQANHLLNDKSTQEYILRDQVILALPNCLPITLHPRNLQRVVTQSVVYASFKSDGTTPNGLSWSSTIPTPCGVTSIVYLYVSEHVDILLAHLVHHLAHIGQVVDSGSQLGMILTFSTEIDKEIVKEFLLPDLGPIKPTKAQPGEGYVCVSEFKPGTH